MAKLDRVCEIRAESNQKLRLATGQTCFEIARLIGSAGLCGVELPRGYEVRSIDREWVLVKWSSLGGEVEFVGSGQESLWTRLGLQTDRPSDLQIRQLAGDLESGLIEELVELVEAQSGAKLQTDLNEENGAELEIVAPTLVGTSPRRRLQIVDMGRPTRRPNERLATRRRVSGERRP